MIDSPALLVLVILGAIALCGIVATIGAVRRDGYRRIPDRSDR